MSKGVPACVISFCCFLRCCCCRRACRSVRWRGDEVGDDDVGDDADVKDMDNGEGDDGDVGDFKGEGAGVASMLLGSEVGKTLLAARSGIGGLVLLGSTTATDDDNEGNGADSTTIGVLSLVTVPGEAGRSVFGSGADNTNESAVAASAVVGAVVEETGCGLCGDDNEGFFCSRC